MYDQVKDQTDQNIKMQDAVNYMELKTKRLIFELCITPPLSLLIVPILVLLLPLILIVVLVLLIMNCFSIDFNGDYI